VKVKALAFAQQQTCGYVESPFAPPNAKWKTGRLIWLPHWNICVLYTLKAEGYVQGK